MTSSADLFDHQDADRAARLALAAQQLADAPDEGKQAAYEEYRAVYRQVHGIPSRVKGSRGPKLPRR